MPIFKFRASKIVRDNGIPRQSGKFSQESGNTGRRAETNVSDTESDRARNLAVAPWSEKLKNSPYTNDLFDKAVAAGHRRRTKVYLARIDNAFGWRRKKGDLKLKPTPDGIVAEYVEPNGELKTEIVDLSEIPRC